MRIKLDKLLIHGGNKLKGEVSIAGAKNAAIAILPATLLVDGPCRIENIPDISDVTKFINVLEMLGAKVTWITKNEIIIDTSYVNTTNCNFDLCKKMRASYYLLGALIGRHKSAEIPFPGGCNFGSRPMDQHIKGIASLGANITIERGIITASTKKLVGSHIYMDVVSVGATINLLLASVLAAGVTTIENAAKEPHIVDLANFLNAMGAKIKGAGTDVIKITGVNKLSGGPTYSIIPDQIEAGTFMIAAAVTKGDVTIKNCIPKHLDSITAKLIEMGINVDELDDAVRVYSKKRPTKANIKTQPYPGFPTDMQPQMAVLLSIAEGTSILTENVWDNRFQYVNELKKLGAEIKIEGRSAIIEGVDKLYGSPLNSTDLRGGAAMIIAGLCADGITEVHCLEHVDRGYEKIEDKLRALGANIERVEE